MSWRGRIAGLCALLFHACPALPATAPVSFTDVERKVILTLSPRRDPAKDSTNSADGNPVAIQLGRLLFFDPRLSGDGRFSCASCHDPARGWTDGKPVAAATGAGSRNTPTLWNVANNRWFFWDGRADTLWSQALKPLENRDEQNGSRLAIAHHLVADDVLRTLYVKVFGPVPNLSDSERFPPSGGPESRNGQQQLDWLQMEPDDQQIVNRLFSNVGKAIAAFEATIRTGAAPFDRFAQELRAGKARPLAISHAAQRGLRIFVGKGDCVVCHSGPNFSNKEFHETRVPPLDAKAPRDNGRSDGAARLVADEFVALGPYSDDPEGPRAQLLKLLADQSGAIGHFKTPTLRNVATTAPFMHQGQFQTLREAVRFYSTLEGAAEPGDPTHVEVLIRPLGLTESEIDDVVAFLESLTSEPLAAPGKATLRN